MHRCKKLQVLAENLELPEAGLPMPIEALESLRGRSHTIKSIGVLEILHETHTDLRTVSTPLRCSTRSLADKACHLGSTI